jgi:hypothetical protein
MRPLSPLRRAPRRNPPAPVAVEAAPSMGRDPEPIAPAKVRGVRPATTGFQAAFRLGLMFPGGRATGKQGDLLSTRYSWQVPFTLDVGVKPTEHWFIGTYMGFSLGAEGNDSKIEGYCVDDDDNLQNDIACNSYTLRLGLEVQYQALPDERWNPWIGYGFGYIVADQSIDDRNKGRNEDTTVSGITYAQISGGVDFRSAVGIGPYGEVSIGRFNTTHTTINNQDTFEGPIEDRAIHYWMSFGFRMVVRP